MLGAALLAGQVALAPAAAAQPFFPFQQLVDAAAQRLATADPVAAAKWINGGPITDNARADQVLDSVAADATAHGIDPQYVREVFTDQIAANEGVQYTRFGQWKFDPGTAPTSAPDLAESRTQINGLNKTLVDEIALHWNSLHSQGCSQDLLGREGSRRCGARTRSAVSAGADVGHAVVLPTYLSSRDIRRSARILPPV